VTRNASRDKIRCSDGHVVAVIGTAGYGHYAEQRLCICSSMGTQEQTVGLLLWARPAGDIDRANAGVLRCQRTY